MSRDTDCLAVIIMAMKSVAMERMHPFVLITFTPECTMQLGEFGKAAYRK